ncbi:hypothetical protein F4678DRAFT_228773 [Xylaria arbuscula]|nr:hypothetical protein F4678DRAFT_228773 [Xylaria arbuscula]
MSFDNDVWRKTIIEIGERVASAFGTTFAPVVQAPPALAMTDAGTVYDLSKDPVWGAGTPSTLKDECGMLWKNGRLYYYRTIALARALADRTLVEKTQKLSLKTEAEKKVRDADNELTTREVVRDKMKAQELRIIASFNKAIGRKPFSKKKGGSNLFRVTKKAQPKKGGKGKGRGK